MSPRPARRTARLLGLASLGLGTSMLVDPRGVARFAGVDDSPVALPVVTAVGARELAHAAGLLAGRPGWAWTRVLGDAVDLTAMGVALGNRSGDRYERLRTVIVGASVLAALDLLTALRSRRRTSEPSLAPVHRSTGGLVAPLIDVRPALAGQPRQPVARTADATPSDATTPDATAVDAAAPSTTTADAAAPSTTTPSTTTPNATTSDATTPNATVSDVAAARMPDAP